MNLADAPFIHNKELLNQVRLVEAKSECKSTHPVVHKFGGSSLCSPLAINRVAGIIGSHCHENDLIIVSAMGDTTDLLFELVRRYTVAEQNNDDKYSPDCSRVEAYQRSLINQTLKTQAGAELIAQLEDDIGRISFLLSRTLAWQTLNADDVISFGELWSTRLVCTVLQHQGIDCQRVDSRALIFTVAQQDTLNSYTHSDSLIDWQKSQQAFNHWHDEFVAQPSTKSSTKVAVISGYIASDQRGNTVTLGRNGSDFSATIIAKLSTASMVYLWTDVNGVYSADPNLFADTKVIPVLGLNEANALASLGSPVFHEKTLKPLQDANIPIRIRNSQLSDEQRSTNKGTLILPQPVPWLGAKTIAAKSSVCLFSISWHNPLLQVERNEQLAEELAYHQLPSYCWSDDKPTLTFCVREDDQQPVERLLNNVDKQCQVTVQQQLSIVSLVGSELLRHSEHLAAYFSLLQKSNKAVLAYHFDSNGAISAVIDDKNPTALVSAIHQAIFVTPLNPLSSESTSKQNQQSVISLVLLGYGNIGRQLIDILAQQLTHINRRGKTRLEVVAVANSSNYIFDPKGVDLVNIDEALAHSTLKTAAIEQCLATINDQQLAVIDVTASQDVARLYADYFGKGRHVVSASKLGITLPSGDYEQLLRLAKSNNSQWLSNVTCGAGLPIQQSISDLVYSGDKINTISGLFSGSLSWILNRYNGKKSFSSVVAQAKALGLTEPDPRDDLSGKDVQRKLLIIARTMGLTLDLEQIELTPLIPERFLAMSGDEFANTSAELDVYMKQKWQHANEQGLRLCYSAQLGFSRQQGEINDEVKLSQASVGLSFRDANDPMICVSAADNIVVIHSDWHNDNPLIIRGPGAGINVTAAGIVADLIKLVV
jgi:aspartokinase/homoserine dehydrogenase 2